MVLEIKIRGLQEKVLRAYACPEYWVLITSGINEPVNPLAVQLETIKPINHLQKVNLIYSKASRIYTLFCQKTLYVQFWFTFPCDLEWISAIQLLARRSMSTINRDWLTRPLALFTGGCRILFLMLNGFNFHWNNGIQSWSLVNAIKNNVLREAELSLTRVVTAPPKVAYTHRNKSMLPSKGDDATFQSNSCPIGQICIS